MNTHKYLMATSAVAIALMTATPALADSNKGNDDSNEKTGFSLNFGGIVKNLSHSFDREGTSTKFGKVVSDLARERNDDRDNDRRDKDHKKATTTVDSSVKISGTVVALNGSTITLTGENGTTYTVNAASSTFNGSSDISSLSQIQVGDRISVKGNLSGSVVTATKITDSSLSQRVLLSKLNGVRAGVVTAVNGSVITLERFGTGTTSVSTTASTFYTVNGTATSSNALTVGSDILVFGPTTTGTVDSITASVVIILNHSVEFLRNLFR